MHAKTGNTVLIFIKDWPVEISFHNIKFFKGWNKVNYEIKKFIDTSCILEIKCTHIYLFEDWTVEISFNKLYKARTKCHMKLRNSCM